MLSSKELLTFSTALKWSYHRWSVSLESVLSWPSRFLIALGLTARKPALPHWISLSSFHAPFPAIPFSISLSTFCAFLWNQSFLALFTSLATNLLWATYLCLSLWWWVFNHFANRTLCFVISCFSVEMFSWNQSGCCLFSWPRTLMADSVRLSLMTSCVPQLCNHSCCYRRAPRGGMTGFHLYTPWPSLLIICSGNWPLSYLFITWNVWNCRAASGTSSYSMMESTDAWNWSNQTESK